MSSEPVATSRTPAARTKGRKFAGKLGVGLFLFFLVKGLLWLLIPALAGLGVFKTCASS